MPYVGETLSLATALVWAFAVILAVLATAALAAPRRQGILAALRPRASWRFTVPGAFLGSYLALVLWLAGMKLTVTGVAAVLNQTSTILLLVLAAVFLGEPFTLRRWAAAGLAFAGIVLVTVG